MKTYATRFPNGRIRCTNCEQLLSEIQKICPNCKSEIIGYVKESENFRSDRAEEIAVKAGKKKAKAIDSVGVKGVIVGLLIVAVFAIVKYFVLPKTSLSYVLNYEQHTEAPTTQKIPEKGGYSYQITQFFIETQESDEAEHEISRMLTESGIDFENLYYTKEGYYTADLIGYGPYTYSTYKEKEEGLMEELVSWGKDNPGILSGKQMHLQSWYKKYR